MIAARPMRPPHVFTQRGQPVLVFGLVDLAAREPLGEHLLRCARGWRLVRLMPGLADVPDEQHDAGDHQSPEHDHADAR